MTSYTPVKRDVAVITEVSVAVCNSLLRNVRTRVAVNKETSVVANDEVTDVVSGYGTVNSFHDVPMKT